MESLHELQIVDLAYADIDNDGVTTLANALKDNTTVKKINLYDNDISDEGAAALADALKVNTSVTTIDLRENKSVTRVQRRLQTR
jgi:Ran GTPase-activating protein (RanGAP) involved in mRNA processing and transport